MKKWKLCNEVILELLQVYGAVKILLVVTFGLLWHFCDHSYHLGDSILGSFWFCWNLSELEYIWNVNNMKWIIWFCPWKVNIFFNYLSHIANFNTSFCQQKKEIVTKIHTFENYDGLSVAKWTLHICVLFILLAGYF